MTLEGSPLRSWLEAFLTRHGAVAGTVHRVAEGGDALHLEAAVRIPPPVLEATRVVPRGKGMAGLALERRRPVTTCNLKDDTSGDVRPGAKAVEATAAAALPIRGDDGRITWVVGLAYADERDLPEAVLVEIGEEAREELGSIGEQTDRA